MRHVPKLSAAFLLGLLLVPGLAHAQMFVPDRETLVKARVLAASESVTEELPGAGVTTTSQLLTVTALGGEEEGKEVTFANDFTQLATGDIFYLRHIVSASEGTEFYSVADPYRLDILLVLALAFVGLILVFGGIQGVRGLLSLVGSLLLIFYLLLPGISSGFPPVAVAIGVASLIIIAGSYITHGINRTTSAAVLGMLITVIITGLAAWWVVEAAQLSGYGSEDSTYLHFQSGGTIDLVGVLLGGILIGLLGVLYDIAIGQAIAVEELMRAGRHLSKRHVYLRALRIGREHIGALVNTLAIAYVGASLPLFLLLEHASAPLDYIVNGEVFATEIVRILIGSSGLVLAVPITTFIAVSLLRVSAVRREEEAVRDTMHRH